MSNTEDSLKAIIAHAKEYGFVFPSSEIYDGLSAIYDYGHNGVELKRNLQQHWWKHMVHNNDNIVGIDAAIFMHPKVWKASGHVDAFNDLLIDNKDSKKRYRVDQLIEDHLQKILDKIEKEIEKAQKRFGEQFDRKLFEETNSRVIEYKKKYETLHKRYKKALNDNNLDELKNIILQEKIVCPVSGTSNWTEVRQFNLMFSTQFGAIDDETSTTIYLRPETAQGIFVNFSQVLKTSRLKIPFGIAQIGKAFRNEIVARQFLLRMREFEQMEMQFFVRPGEEMKWYEYWKEQRWQWHLSLGFPEQKLRWHEHEKLAHYANAACDIEFAFPFGFKEIEGIHSRTDFDLANHEKFSGKKLRYFDHETNESYIPYVIETSIGLDRTFFAVFVNSYRIEKLKDGTTREVLNLPYFLAPCKIAVLPLVRKDGMPEMAKSIYEDLKKTFVSQYDEKDSIGRRYRRQDAIGTPFCITVDNQSLIDHTVTIRERNSMQQIRINASNLKSYLETKLNS